MIRMITPVCQRPRLQQLLRAGLCALLSLASLTACNTVQGAKEGAGRDLQRIGQTLQRGGEALERGMATTQPPAPVDSRNTPY